MFSLISIYQELNISCTKLFYVFLYILFIDLNVHDVIISIRGLVFF